MFDRKESSEKKMLAPITNIFQSNKETLKNSWIKHYENYMALFYQNIFKPE